MKAHPRRSRPTRTSAPEARPEPTAQIEATIDALLLLQTRLGGADAALGPRGEDTP